MRAAGRGIVPGVFALTCGLFGLPGNVGAAVLLKSPASAAEASRDTGPAQARQLFLEARSYERAGLDSAALILYRRAADEDSRNRELCFMVLERLRAASPVDTAFAFARRCAGLPGVGTLTEWKSLGEIALRAENDSAALGYFRRALALNEDDGEVLYVLAGLYEDARDWARYVEVTEPLVKKLGYPAPLVERLLHADAELDRSDAALKLLKDAWSATGRLPYGQALANFYDGREMPLSLLDVARALAAAQPDPEQEWRLARAYAAADRPDSALLVCERLLKSLNDSDLGVRAFRGSLLFERGRYADAYAEAAALAKLRPEAPSLLFLQGSSALELGRRDARPLLAKALSFVPLAPDYRARLAYADYAIGAGFKSHSKGAGLAVPSTLTYVVADTLKAEQAGMLEGFAHGQLARMLDPREPWERRAVFSDTILARRHRRMAIERFEHATRDVPGSSDSNAILPNAPGRRAALFELASHLERLGERPRAREVLRRLIRQDSSQAMALNYLGYLLVENAPVDSAALAEAGDLLDRAVNIEPENGAYLDSKGWWFYRRGDLDSARVLLDRAAHAIPSDPSILLHQVDVFQALGRPADACAAWREIVRRDPRRQAPAECGR